MPTVPNENPAPASLFGPDGLPTHYDPLWQTYTDLASHPGAMAWFRSQPQWFAKYACVAHWHKEIFIIDNQLKMPYQDGSVVDIPDATKTFPAIQAKIATVRQSMANTLAMINAPGITQTGVSVPVIVGPATPITSTDQIDAIIAALGV